VDRLDELQKIVAKFVSERSWEKFHNPKNLSMSIAIEAAELMELFQWSTIEESVNQLDEDDQFRFQFEDELADVLIYCISLANSTKTDIPAIISRKMKRNNSRFPTKLHS
jgi:NTP pyrophosphatase (non-canonical NTP hydrolase)